jgi:hypothetical protein
VERFAAPAVDDGFNGIRRLRPVFRLARISGQALVVGRKFNFFSKRFNFDFDFNFNFKGGAGGVGFYVSC